VAQAATGHLPDPKFDNDVQELNLNSVNLYAKKLIHLTATDEHRKNFALTHINHSPDQRIELAFPGVHSDIGGSYVDKAGEDIVIMQANWNGEEAFEKEKYKLYEQGWYTKSDIFTMSRTKLIGTRNHLSNKYSFIPLHIMYKFANDYKKNEIFKSQLKNKYLVPTPGRTNKESMQSIIQQRFDEELWEHHDRAKNKKELLAKTELYLDMERNKHVGIIPYEEEVLMYVKQKLERYAFEDQWPLIYKTAQDILNHCTLDDHSGYTAKIIRQKSSAVVAEIIDQIFLRVLRNRFLHQSARYKGYANPHAPDPSGHRTHYY
jgi:hypothetical protein